MDSQANSQTQEPWLLRRGNGEVLACASAVLLFLMTLAFGFVYDDVPQILKNPAIQSWRFFPGYFTSHVWSSIYPGSTGNYYRPLFLLWLGVNRALFGTNPTGWHLTGVACHAVATWLVFRLTLKLAADRGVAFVAGLIFAVHPAHVESVAWISGVVDPLATCFVLGSFLAFLLFRESGGNGRRISSLCLFALALLTKETAAVLPGLILLYSFLSTEDPRGGCQVSAAGPRAIRDTLPYLGILLAYGCARYLALHGFSHATSTLSWEDVLLTWPSVLLFYARHLILPYRSSEFYSLGYVTRATGASVVRPTAALAGLALAVFVFLRAMRVSHPRTRIAMWVSLGFLLLPILPVLNLRSLTPGDVVHDRYLYLPSVGFAILFAMTLRELGRRVPRRQLSLELALAVATGAVLGGLTVAQEMQWADDIALYSEGVKSAPDNLTVRDNLANALVAANQPERSIPIYLDVLRRNPEFWRSNYNLGFAYYRTANYPAAEQYLERANRIDPSDADQYIYLSLAQARQGKTAEAIRNAELAIERAPHANGYHAVLGMIYRQAGDRRNAIDQFQAELADHPDNLAVVSELQTLQSVSPTP